MNFAFVIYLAETPGRQKYHAKKMTLHVSNASKKVVLEGLMKKIALKKEIKVDIQAVIFDSRYGQLLS